MLLAVCLPTYFGQLSMQAASLAVGSLLCSLPARLAATSQTAPAPALRPRMPSSPCSLGLRLPSPTAG